MNKYEKRARTWISKITGYAESDIVYSNNSSPDFKTPAGTAFEIKLTKNRNISFGPRQFSNLIVNFPDCLVAVFNKESDAPISLFPIRAIKPKYWIPVGSIKVDGISIHFSKEYARVSREEYFNKVKKKATESDRTPVT